MSIYPDWLSECPEVSDGGSEIRYVADKALTFSSEPVSAVFDGEREIRVIEGTLVDIDFIREKVDY